LEIEPSEREWKPEWQATLRQFNLFHGEPKELKKLPFKFSYVFRCADTGDRPHRAMIEDWELGVLFLKEVERLGSEEAAASNVKKKFFNEIVVLAKIPVSSWVRSSPTTLGGHRDLLASKNLPAVIVVNRGHP